jgi:hypothetical protein
MKKFESQLGNNVLFCENLDDMIQNMEYDSVLLAKDIIPVLERCNPKYPYDCDVLMMLVARIAAMVIANVEGDDYDAEKRVRNSFEYYLECFRKAKKGEIECEVFDVE